MVYNWGKVGVVTDHECFAFKSTMQEIITQAIAEERERVVEAMMMEGIEAKMTPFQTTVNQYLRNRAKEIGIDLSLDKLTDNK